MPRAKKQAHEVADKRNGVALDLTASGTMAIPEPPEGVGEAGITAWNNYWASPMAQLATEADTIVLTRYAVAVDEWHAAQVEFSQERVVNGSQGQPRLHPLATWIQSREAVLQGLEDRLGLSPLSRMKLGVAVGEAHRSLAEMNERFREEVSGTNSDSSEDQDWDFDAEEDDPEAA